MRRTTGDAGSDSLLERLKWSQLTKIEKFAAGCARKLEARHMRTGCDVHHGCWARGDARGAGLSGRCAVSSEAPMVVGRG
jgi:hypothetical protein